MTDERDETLLEVRALDVFYGPMQAVHDLAFRVGTGDVVALLGANGAGKSTVLRALSGLIPARAGAMTLLGQTLKRQSPEARVRLGMALVPDDRRLFSTLTVDENLRAGGSRLRRAEVGEQMDRVLGYFPALAERRRQRAGSLSGGQAQMLAIGRALMTRPKLLMLDEPSQGLAPKIVEELFQLIGHLSGNERLTILLVEQNASLALDVAGFGYVLRNGRLALAGSTSELRANDAIRELYLGG
ncbi:MAG TPA: ABC transporter ATP-binding protein [Chloroflexota bacterium]|nr:ABC transporter ATP-binding protein [Chloroflexota bacterium]